MRRVVTAMAGGAAVLAIAGCSSSEEGTNRSQDISALPKAGVSAAAFARTYQEAVNAQQWQRVCQMRTERYRHGTISACVEDHTDTTPSATPSPSESTDPPLRRADGSIVPPKSTPSESGPDRANTGPVKTGQQVAVPAIGEHPAGTGVGVEYTVTWPDSTTTTKKALRLVKQGDEWLVDQSEEIAASDEAHGNPVRDALLRE
ncbi:hypothetical protein [Streptomyces minutiscleroticus]|uniref:Lipoprotein n=1 Tax=Streptomyces minutiscleroticus TaxID=68238 RepID=A0A918NYA9_9ACTN|nr:hypothetical protein [Streptomyces minutiscleroticus]GGY06659.1 hypothetical protein GCM10010358_69910 [Streptomyces minutiscleroticus]